MFAEISLFLSVVFLNNQLDGVGDIVFNLLDARGGYLGFDYRVSMLTRKKLLHFSNEKGQIY